MAGTWTIPSNTPKDSAAKQKITGDMNCDRGRKPITGYNAIDICAIVNGPSIKNLHPMTMQEYISAAGTKTYAKRYIGM
jgi:hypothetical protein